MNKLHWKKGIACGGLFLALLGLTFYILLSDQDPGKLWTALGQAEWSWLAVGAACMMLFFCCEAKNIQTGLGLFGSPAPYASCLLYAMYRDGHAPAPGALALLTDFFSFQLAAVFWASVGFFLHHAQLVRLGNGVWLCFAFGAALNLLVVLALCGAVFSPRALPTLWGWLMRPARRLFPHRAESWRRWGERQWKDLRQCTRCYRTHKRQLGKMFLTSLVQLAAYHSVPFWVYLAFGMQG